MKYEKRIRRITAPLVILLMFSALYPAIAGASPVLPPWRMENPWTSRTGTIDVGDQTLSIEIADTPDLRTRGLGYRDGLEPDAGMLFVYDQPASRSFWMKGMRFCLDIIWIEHEQVVGAAESVCPIEGATDQQLPSYRSPVPVRYVLEVPAGWMAEHGIVAGTPVTIHLPA
jgi:uncharacterized membrane protein (UPF0127 family)